MFEDIVRILEKTNDTIRDTIPQTTAWKAVVEKSAVEASLIHRLLPEIYKYWHNKREKLGRPLCRRFWPPTLASDSNPHAVFR
jgi:hypothetical protein